MSRDKRAAARTVRKVLRLLRCSPEAYAFAFADTILWGASGRTVRRWADGDSIPAAPVLSSIREHVRQLEARNA